MKQLGIFLSHLEGMLVHRRVTPSIKFEGNYLYTWMERGTLRVKCLAQEHNTMSRPGLEPRQFDPESRLHVLANMRQPQLHKKIIHKVLGQSHCNVYAEKQIGSISNKHTWQIGAHPWANILTSHPGFQDNLLYLVLLSLYPSFFWEWKAKDS